MTRMAHAMTVKLEHFLGLAPCIQQSDGKVKVTPHAFVPLCGQHRADVPPDVGHIEPTSLRHSAGGEKSFCGDFEGSPTIGEGPFESLATT